ncbi:hypothetical protein [Roseovarius sp.]|uniref:hypothetical protein n=1 Tax=Roseovarius sp. TaxID=1486281 RepID=UPI0026113E4D|nr:hypothetical protein [Roseovarius sp.]
MDLRQPETWQRHQLATTERMQADISRYTRPVISAMGISSLSYLMTWGPLVAFWGVNNMPWLPLLATALSACIVTLTAPAFALAVGIEGYFMRRLRALETVAP